jgi:transposase-like protein
MKTMHVLEAPESSTSFSAAVGEMQGARRATGISHMAEAAAGKGAQEHPDPEVPEKIPRRRFSAGYKLRVLEQADRCTQPGEIGALLRREGLYSSHLTTWRRQREEGLLRGLAPKKRGRKKKLADPSAGRIAQLEQENRRLKHRLRQAEIIIDAQKKISEILGIEQNLKETGGDE